ncbi:hypothetical protein CRYPD_14 [uncultured Candidatus Thioglobus sp.]|nr:hypothetical protein CRYPD_14 [uncultured Candidatus Thioglobus sp.]
MFQNHWLSIARHNSEPLVHIIHNHWLGMTHNNSNTIGSA